MKLPISPKHEIHYGIITKECEAEFVEWIKTLMSLPNTNKDEIARAIYNGVTSLGFSEGYDSCSYDHDL